MLTSVKSAAKNVSKGVTTSVRKVRSGASTAEVLDGRKVRALLKDEKEFVAYLNKYFDLLDKDAGGTLTRDELKPALIRFGTLLGLPSPGTAADADAMVDRLFTHLMAEDPGEEIDRDTFVIVSKNFLSAVASGLEEKPLVVHVFDGSVLQELAENEELFDVIVDDFFAQFDEDKSGKLARDEILPALVSLGLVPPTGAKPESDALLSRILGKYAGKDLELDVGEFKALLRDVLNELSSELKSAPVVVSTELLPVMTAPTLRQVMKDPARLRSFAEAIFVEWDTLKKGRMSKSDVMKGFKDLCASYRVPIADDEQAEAMCLASCIFMNADADATGFIEEKEFPGLLAEIMENLAKRLDNDPKAAAAATTQPTQTWLRDWFRSDSLRERSEPTALADAPADAPAAAPAVAPAPAPAAAAAVAPAAAPAAASAAAVPKATSKKNAIETASSRKKPASGRSAAEIKAAYNYKPSDAVIKAREKLEARQKKMQEMADNAQNLEDDSAEFEELSKQLAEKMKKKWW